MIHRYQPDSVCGPRALWVALLGLLLAGCVNWPQPYSPDPIADYRQQAGQSDSLTTEVERADSSRRQAEFEAQQRERQAEAGRQQQNDEDSAQGRETLAAGEEESTHMTPAEARRAAARARFEARQAARSAASSVRGAAAGVSMPTVVVPSVIPR